MGFHVTLGECKYLFFLGLGLRAHLGLGLSIFAWLRWAYKIWVWADINLDTFLEPS